jgi:hypothetical protein
MARINRATSVALSADGNTAVVGAPGDNPDSNGRGSGAVWVFTSSNGVWTQQGSKLVGTGADGYAQQGSSVALSADGNTVIVGGPGDDPCGSLGPGCLGTSGATWVYTRSGSVWTQQGGKLVASDAVGIAHQGFSVALSGGGNTAIAAGLATATMAPGRRGFSPSRRPPRCKSPQPPTWSPQAIQAVPSPYQLSATAGINYSISGLPPWLDAISKPPSDTNPPSGTGPRP